MRTFVLVAVATAVLLVTLSVVAAADSSSSSNVFAAFCRRNGALCDELSAHGMMHRHEMVPEVALAFWRSTLEATLHSLLQAAQQEAQQHRKNNDDRQPLLAQLQRSGVFRKFRRHGDDKAWVDKLTHDDTQELRRIIEASGLAGATTAAVAGDNSKYPWFGFVPIFVTSTPIGGGAEAVAPATDCSTWTSIWASLPSAGSTKVTVTVNTTFEPSAPLFCTDYWHFAIGPSHVDAPTTKSGVFTFDIDVAKNLASPALAWDLTNKGLRVFRNIKNAIARDLDIVDTLMLFLPMITGELDEKSAQANMNFFNEYTKITPPIAPRAFKGILPLPESEIHSGDFIAKSELDGLGPMEGLGQGTSAGHVSVALRNEASGELMICESVIKGVTCTPYRPWISNLQRVGMMTVLVPLAKKHREAFNLTGAWAWVNATYGNGYGYPNFLMGWLDSVTGNLPSFPPSFGDKSKDRNARALTFEAMELFLWRINDVAPHVVSFFVGQALNHRVGTWNSNGGLGFAEVLQAAGAAQSLGSLLVIPEQDRWRYNTTRRGVPGSMLLPAQVCSTLGMNILRHAGVFKSTSEDFQATEIQCWDAYSLALWDSDRVGDGRPAVCKQADPLNNLCQLSGNYTFYLQQAQNGGFNTRVPYAHMNEKCWTLNPAPYNHQGCTKP